VVGGSLSSIPKPKEAEEEKCPRTERKKVSFVGHRNERRRNQNRKTNVGVQISVSTESFSNDSYQDTLYIPLFGVSNQTVTGYIPSH
jgi:hypothetical protein